MQDISMSIYNCGHRIFSRKIVLPGLPVLVPSLFLLPSSCLFWRTRLSNAILGNRSYKNENMTSWSSKPYVIVIGKWLSLLMFWEGTITNVANVEQAVIWEIVT